MPIRIFIRVGEGGSDEDGLGVFEADPSTTTLRDVVERVHSICSDFSLCSFEGGVAGQAIDFRDPSVCLQPLASIIPHVAPRAAANGLTEFADSQGLWFVVRRFLKNMEGADACGSSGRHVECLDGRHINASGTAQSNIEKEENKAVDEETEAEESWTLIHRASENGHIDTVRLLVKELGADVNAMRDTPSFDEKNKIKYK